MEEEKKKTTKKTTTKKPSSSVKKTTTKKSPTKKTEAKPTKKSTTKKATKKITTKKSSSKKESTKKTTTKIKTTKSSKSTTKATKSTSSKKTTPKSTTTKSKSTTKKAPTKKTSSSSVKKATSTKPKTTTKKRTAKLPTIEPSKIIEDQNIEENNHKISDDKKQTQEELIITRELDIKLDDYTYNQEGLVEKVKEILEKESNENISQNLEDPLNGEELFTDIFEDNKSIFKKFSKKVKNATNKVKAKTQKNKIEHQKKKIEKQPNKEPIQPVVEKEIFPKREEKYKDIAIQREKEIATRKQKQQEKFEQILLKGQKQATPKTKEKKSPKTFIFLFLLLLTIVIGLFIFNFANTSIENINLQKEKEQQKKAKEKEQLLLKQYNECLNAPSSDEEYSEELNQKISQLTEYIQNNYQASILYEDLTSGYTFEYEAQKSYYAASTIKLVDGLYIYTKAANGEINLDDTITYTKKSAVPASKAMAKISYGTKVSLRDLVKYAIEVSDNTAHQLLIKYIGYSNLKAYGESLGATSILDGSDNFGYINVTDAMIYLKTLNEFINNKSEYSTELQNYLLNAEQNDLALPDFGIKAAHKYGEYGSVYHDIGIVYDQHPYAVAILTNEGNSKNFENKVKDINKHIYELHQEFYTNHEQICQHKIYGK